MSKPINWIKLSSRRTDQTTENNLQEMQARRQGRGGGLRGESQKGPPDGIVKDLKWYKTNVMVVGLTI